MGCCGSKPSDEASATVISSATPPSNHHRHPKARRRYHNKRYPVANPSSPKPSKAQAHASVSPLTSLDDIKEVLAVPHTNPMPPRRRTTNSSSNSIESGPRTKPKPKPKPKKKHSGPAASSFSFEKSGVGERTHNSILLASDIWSITNSAISPPLRLPSRGNRAIPLSSEIWSITDGPPMAAANYLSPLRRESPIRRDVEFGRRQNSYDSPGNRRERRGLYLAKESSLSRERRATAISPQKRERERGERYSSSGSGRKESGSQWSAAGSIEMRRKEDGSGRRKTVSPAGREEDRSGKKNGRGGGAATVSPVKENRRRKGRGRSGVVSAKEQAKESSDSSLSIEGFVFP